MTLTTGDKVAYGVAATAVVLYGVKATGALDSLPSTTTVNGEPVDGSDGGGFPIWGYGVLIIIALALVAYVTRETVG